MQKKRASCGVYCIDEVLLGKGVSEEAGFEGKSPEENKQCYCEP